MTHEPDDDVRQALRRHADSITPRGTYADLEAKLAAADAGRRVTARHVVLGLAAAIALVVGALVVAVATDGDDQEVRTANGPTTTVEPTTTSTDPTTTLPAPTVTVTATAPTTTEATTSTTAATTTTTSTPATTTTTTLPPGPTPLDDRATVYLGGIGELVLPAGIAEAETATGRRVDGDLESGPSVCSYGTFVDGPTDVTLMIENRDPTFDGDAHALGDRGRVVRLDVGPEGRVRALGRGARVGIGSTEAQVLAAFPGADVQPHKYVEGGHDIVVTDHDSPDAMLVFETDGSVVTAFRTGLPEYVELSEGCY